MSPALLFKQLQTVRNLRYIKSIDALIGQKNLMMIESHDCLIGLTEMCDLPQNTKCLYVRFCPSVSIEKIQKIKAHIEKNYGLGCTICEWSLPIRLDIRFGINTSI